MVKTGGGSLLLHFKDARAKIGFKKGYSRIYGYKERVGRSTESRVGIRGSLYVSFL